MMAAIAEAKESAQDVPVGAAIVSETGRVVAVAHNQREISNDATAHAEILAISRAGRVTGDWRLSECTMFVTLEPCVMCAGAILEARIPRLVFGAYAQKNGASGSRFDLLRESRLGSSVEVIPGVESDRCAQLLTTFFESRRPIVGA